MAPSPEMNVQRPSKSSVVRVVHHVLPALLAVATHGACAAPSAQAPEDEDAQDTENVDDSFLAGERLGPLPDTLAELGLFPDLEALEEPHVDAISFRPAHRLWTNGASKQRLLFLPPGTSVDTSAVPWRFPRGAVLAKTFFYPGRHDRPTPVETRILRHGAAGWDYAVYLWNEEATDAALLDGAAPVPVAVTIGEERFEHVVPSTLQCRSCHESAPGMVLGFDELRLAEPREPGEVTQLERFYEDGWLGALPEQPARIIAEDEATRSVLGYLEGNCTHCHNGGDGPASAFDLRHPVALEHLVDVPTTSELVGGWRVRSGAPEESGLFLALSRAEVTTAQPMPPLGVERVDEAAVELFRAWITGLGEVRDER